MAGPFGGGFGGGGFGGGGFGGGFGGQYQNNGQFPQGFPNNQQYQNFQYCPSLPTMYDIQR